MKQMLGTLAVIFFLLATGAAQAGPKPPEPPASPLFSVETLKGAVSVRGDGRTFAVTITPVDGRGVQRFDLETAEPAGAAVSFRAAEAEIHYWMGHLVVIAPEARKALHFSVPGIEQHLRPRTDGPQLDSAAAVAELDTLLRSSYALTRIETVTSLVSRNEKALKLPFVEPGLRKETEYPDPFPSGGGLGGCGSSCSITCGDGSSCSTACSSPRCASCSCPASCSCS